MYELLIHDVVTLVTTSSGVLINLFLLYVIFTDHSLAAAGYKKMLAIISIYNIYFSIVHKIVEPIYLVDRWGFICFSKNFVHRGSYLANWIAMALYVNSVAQSLSLLGVHCLFRYSIITGNFKYLFTTWWGLLSVLLSHSIAGALYVCFCVFGMRPSPARKVLSSKDLMFYMNVTLEDSVYYYGPVFRFPDEEGVEEYRWDQIIGSTACLIILGAFYLLICVTGVKLYFYLKRTVMAPTMRKIQLQLLYVLLAQAVSPLICEFLPAAFIIYGGVLGVIGPVHGIFMSMFFAGYSPVDATLVLILFKAYRRRALEILSKPVPCLRNHCLKSRIYISDSIQNSSHNNNNNNNTSKPNQMNLNF